eukprot:Pgem_evm1s15984
MQIFSECLYYSLLNGMDNIGENPSLESTPAVPLEDRFFRVTSEMFRSNPDYFELVELHELTLGHFLKECLWEFKHNIIQTLINARNKGKIIKLLDSFSDDNNLDSCLDNIENLLAQKIIVNVQIARQKNSLNLNKIKQLLDGIYYVSLSSLTDKRVSAFFLFSLLLIQKTLLPLYHEFENGNEERKNEICSLIVTSRKLLHELNPNIFIGRKSLSKSLYAWSIDLYNNVSNTEKDESECVNASKWLMDIAMK